MDSVLFRATQPLTVFLESLKALRGSGGYIVVCGQSFSEEEVQNIRHLAMYNILYIKVREETQCSPLLYQDK